MNDNLTTMFSKIDRADGTMARLNALLHLSFDHVSGGALDEPDMGTLGFALLMARQELDVLQANNRQLHETFKSLRQDVESIGRDQARRELEPPAPISTKQQRETTDVPRMKKVA